MATNSSAGTLKRSAPAPLLPPLGTFRAPSAASSSSASSSCSPSVPPPMSAGVISRPGILKTTAVPASSSSVIEFQNAPVSAQVPLAPDVAGPSGIVTVPNCSTNRPTSILKQSAGAALQALPQATVENSGLGFNSSCQQCIAERAIASTSNSSSGVNTVSK